jgi:RHS repeat-associated protein
VEPYRYGFNGKEQDPEVKGVGNFYDYGMRGYDPRIGRFPSVDPLAPKYPYFSPYQYAGNNPIYNIDVDGLENIAANKAQGKAGETFARTRLQMTKEYQVYEQVTVRPAGTTKVDNTVNDFLLRDEVKGDFYKVEIKTGNAVPSTGQTNLDNSIMKGELTEMRSSKPDVSDAVPTGNKFKISGSITARVDPQTGQVKIESKIANPNTKDAMGRMNDIENTLKNPGQKSTINQILKDNMTEIPAEALEAPTLAPARLPSIAPIVSSPKPIEGPIIVEPTPTTELPIGEIVPL